MNGAENEKTGRAEIRKLARRSDFIRWIGRKDEVGSISVAGNH
jgi:hypothetical protein